MAAIRINLESAVGDVKSHYQELLAPVYLWMTGGREAALATGAADLADVLGAGGLAVDLGAGFGMHAIPLARAGYEVLALDTSEHLVEQLKELGQGLPIQAVVADLMSFPLALPAGRKADLMVCMGDTLTHLPEPALVDRLAALIAQDLAATGTFVATFRDYTALPAGIARFIPVRSDDSRILTCFLEDRGTAVAVHDLLHQRTDQGWTLQVSQYSKLKLFPAEVAEAFRRCGLEATISSGPRGMVRLTASR